MKINVGSPNMKSMWPASWAEVGAGEREEKRGRREGGVEGRRWGGGVH